MTLTALPAESQRENSHPDDPRHVSEWAEWLRAGLDPGWRAGEWDMSLLLFVGDPNNPRTSVGVCAVHRCGVIIPSLSGGYCTSCHSARTQSGLAKEDFDATHTRHFRRGNAARGSAACAVPSCARSAYSQGMCISHYRGWVKARRHPGIDKAEWMAAREPLPEPKPCIVLGCPRERTCGNGLCPTHQARWRRTRDETDPTRWGDTADAARWAERQLPYLAAHMFSLAPLSPIARLEMLSALQRRDARGQNLSPQAVRGSVARLSSLPSIALAGEAFPECRWSADSTAAMYEGTRALLKGLRWEISTAFDQFKGTDPTQRDIWDLRTVSQVIPSLKMGASPLRNASSLDFGEVRQKWLRDALMHWARTTNPTSHSLLRWHTACVVASRALESRPGGGHDSGVLRFSDVTAVVDGFKVAPNKKGEPYSPSYQNHLLVNFFELLEFGRREEILDDLSPRFVRHPGHHTIKPVDDNEDEIGKSIPELVIRQLDGHVHLLGAGFPYGDLPPEAVTAMFGTAYVILRDTGRRPAEVVGLDVDCLELDKDEHQLVWHNMKGRRLRRRLPILQQTADAIKTWREIRVRLDLPTNSIGHLFPAITNRYRHLDSGNLSRAVRSWADLIPTLESDELGSLGTPLPFDRSKIFPYAFRHTFCQRYADAGIPMHVLQALMDHRSANTTSSYYQVSKKMKREAVDTLRGLTVDRHGQPAPMSSAVSYEVRSVAVPWGNCIEPSNVKAGGKACPIRFQCAGCSSYRPDPSHLPSIEDQIRSLKENLELAHAMGTADYTIRGMEGEIADYQSVISTMKTKLESMPDEERREVHEASRILRRLRAGATAPSPAFLAMPLVRPTGKTAP